MKHGDFKIGMKFKTATGEWMVTDIGTRVIVAAKWKEGWTAGPPYAVDEVVFDEYDMEGCDLADPEYTWYEDGGAMLDQIICKCGWKSATFFDGREYAHAQWKKHMTDGSHAVNDNKSSPDKVGY